MDYWTSFGASVIGPGHIAAGKPNQDSWGSFSYGFCTGIAVSDGLGSKDYSQFGSAAACAAIERAAFRMWIEGDDAPDETFLDNVRDYWLERIAPLEPRSAAATCLFGIVFNSTVWIGQLGDGCAAIVRKDGKVTILSDNKADSFSNITDSLTANVTANKWRITCVPESECSAIVLCTDGVSDDIEGQNNLEGFVKGFASFSAGLATAAAAREARAMLDNWPTPKHTDDKTIACLLRKEASDD